MKDLILVITTFYDSGREMEEIFTFDDDISPERLKLTQTATDFGGCRLDKINKYVVELRKVR